MARSTFPLAPTRSGATVLFVFLLVACASTPSSSRQRVAAAPASVPAQSAAVVHTPSPIGPPQPASPADLARGRERGWGWMVDKLIADGVSPARAAKAFADPRMPAFEGLLFGLNPHESTFLYRNFLKPRSVEQAERCAEDHAPELLAAQRLHGVDASVVAAIMHVESHCGRNTGNSLVLHRLARLAMANEPHNVARNLARATNRRGAIDAELAERIRSRARYLEGVFYPQVVATFEVARQEGIDPLSIRGSGAGAFGTVQFLPMNYVAFGTDADGDGRVSLYDPADAAASCARFLASYGWKPGLSRARKREIIWNYNRSDAYIDTVLALADRIAASGALAAGHHSEATEAQALPASTAAHRGAPALRHP